MSRSARKSKKFQKFNLELFYFIWNIALFWLQNRNKSVIIFANFVRLRERELKQPLSLKRGRINYSFIFDTKNKSYCTDLVGKAYSEIGVNLNKDKLTTSVYDLLISSDTYISYYYCKDGNGVKHIYYLV